MKYVIFDLDGTLADISERRAISLKPDGSMNWGTFFEPENVSLDVPNQPIIDLYNILQQSEHVRVIIFSGRSAVMIQETLNWFRKHGVGIPYMLKMRKEKDYTPDDELKSDWLDTLYKNENITADDILFAVDDREKVVKMWREKGLCCLQCAEGAFLY